MSLPVAAIKALGYLAPVESLPDLLLIQISFVRGLLHLTRSEKTHQTY